MATSLQIKDRSISIIGVGGKTVISAAKAATGKGVEYAKMGVEGAKYVGKKGYEYGKEGATYAGKKGYELGAGAYNGVKENETVKSVVGEVYGKAIGVGGLVKGYLSKVGGAAKAPAEGASTEGEEPVKEESSAIPGAKKSNEEKKEEQNE
jgi:ribosomal protein L12E/L44/L45/RPP1/RPP2